MSLDIVFSAVHRHFARNTCLSGINLAAVLRVCALINIILGPLNVNMRLMQLG
jgi:hypothetical protein